MFSSELVCNIILFINQNIDEEIRIDMLTQKFYYNRTYIMKKFKQEIGLSIIKYYNTMKIYNSLKDLKYKKSILSIALKNGFNSQEYYCEIFKSILGVSPLAYKKYIAYIYKCNQHDIDIIQENILKIETLRLNIQNYLDNRKPQTTIKKLSILDNI